MKTGYNNEQLIFISEVIYTKTHRTITRLGQNAFEKTPGRKPVWSSTEQEWGCDNEQLVFINKRIAQCTQVEFTVGITQQARSLFF